MSSDDEEHRESESYLAASFACGRGGWGNSEGGIKKKNYLPVWSRGIEKYFPLS